MERNDEIRLILRKNYVTQRNFTVDRLILARYRDRSVTAPSLSSTVHGLTSVIVHRSTYFNKNPGQGRCTVLGLLYKTNSHKIVTEWSRQRARIKRSTLHIYIFYLRSKITYIYKYKYILNTYPYKYIFLMKVMSLKNR